MRSYSLALLVATSALVPGCLSAGARLSAGPTLTTQHEIGLEVVLGVHVGFAASDRQAIETGVAGRTGSRGGAALDGHAAYHFIDERWSGWAGIGSEIAGTGERAALTGFAAVARNLRYRHASGCDHEKGWGPCTARSSALSLGIELRGGFAEAAGDPQTRHGLFAVAPVVDWTMISALR